MSFFTNKTLFLFNNRRRLVPNKTPMFSYHKRRSSCLNTRHWSCLRTRDIVLVRNNTLFLPQIKRPCSCSTARHYSCSRTVFLFKNKTLLLFKSSTLFMLKGETLDPVSSFVTRLASWIPSAALLCRHAAGRNAVGMFALLPSGCASE